jgi:hypothetical protein
MSVLSFIAKKVGGAVDDLIPSAGDLVETLCDKIGLPEAIGDYAACVTDLATGNYLAAAASGAELIGDFCEPDAPSESYYSETSTDYGDDILPLSEDGNSSSSASNVASSSSSETRSSEGAASANQNVAAGSFANMSNADFMDMIRSGNISKEVLDDPAAMMALQQKMSDIKQMNDLLSNLMRMLHDMQSQIVGNIRA